MSKCSGISRDLRTGFEAMKRLILLSILVCPAFGAADEHDDREMRLTVKPVLCITDRRTPHCDMSFLVVWRSSVSGYYCLFSDLGDTPLRCWNEELTGELTDERTVEAEFSYWMAGDDRNLRLAQVEVEVLRMDSDDRRRRRRTRHVWDIN